MTPKPGPTPDATNDQDPTLILAAKVHPRPLTAETLPTIPDYILHGELGRGGMGIVYKAQRAGDDQAVAL